MYKKALSTNRDTIVLVNPPNAKIVLRDMYSSTISKGSYNWPCVDLLVLSGILKDVFDVKFIDANTLGLSVKETVNLISSYNPRGVCFSIGNSVKNDDYFFVASLRERLQDIKLAGTGGLLIHNAEYELKNHREFDACIINFTTDDIVKYFEDDFGNMNNIVYRSNDKIVRTPTKQSENGYSYPVPLHEQLPLKSYNLSHGKSKPLTSVLTSYGCPAVCSFCVSEKIEYRYRNPQNVIEELKVIRELDVREIFFRDPVFCANKKQGHRLMEMMIQNDFGFYWVADTRVNVLSEETARLMKKSGCHALHFGVESANARILSKYNKGINIDKVKTAFKICNNYGIETVGYFILGLPGETVDDVRRTIDLAIELDCDYASFNTPLPIIGTSLRDEAIQNRWIEDVHDDAYDGSFLPLIETESLSKRDIVELQNLAYKKFYLRPMYIFKMILKLRSIYKTKMLFLEFLRMVRKLSYRFINDITT